MRMISGDFSTSSYDHDDSALDAEPWNELNSVDQLIALQREVFEAELEQNLSRFGGLSLAMAGIERKLGNAQEAIAYTDQAATAFESAGVSQLALAAKATLAKEYRQASAPNLALGAIREASQIPLMAGDQANAGVRWRAGQHVASIASAAIDLLHTYSGEHNAILSWHFDFETLPKGSSLPDRKVAGELFEALDGLLEIPVYATNEVASQSMHYLSFAHTCLANRRMGLGRNDRRLARAQAQQLLGCYIKLNFDGKEKGSSSSAFHDTGVTSLHDLVDYSFESTDWLARIFAR